MRNKFNRAIAAATLAAIAMTSVGVGAATAAPVTKQQTVAAGSTDFSARKRRYNRGADRAVLGAVVGLFGTIATLAARDRYERHYGYYGRPYYAPYGYGPPAPYGYYGPGPYYYR
jgi:hypothetical protein